MFGWLRRLGKDRDPIELARAAFDREHPDSRSWGAMVVGNESYGHVVLVFHGKRRPPQIEKYVVGKHSSAIAHRITDDGGYRPHGWR